jgi:hypothetical protein
MIPPTVVRAPIVYAAQPATQSIFDIHHPPLLGVRGQDKGPLPEGMLLNERHM